MTSAYDDLLKRLQTGFDAVSPGADPVLRPSDHADFQANGVMAVAKALGKNPRDVASDIVATLDLGDAAEVEIAGPGFLNIRLKPSFISSKLQALQSDERLGLAVATSPRRVVIDYSAPNVAKEMHVGHLRGTVIGDALARMHRFFGHEVIARNHVGDWGTPFGMLIEHLLDIGEDEAAHELSIGDLDTFYKAARAKFDADENFQERSRARVVALQSGDVETRRLWRVLVDQSVAYFSEVYQKLDITLKVDDIAGESYYNDMLQDVVDDLSTKGLLVDSGGALCVFPPGFTNREGEAQPVIVRKSDEGFGYSATDLAALRDRIDHLHADEILYVVGAPQAQHFQMIFAVARMAHWIDDSVRVEHVSFGSVLGPDRKPFKTRAGSTVKLIELIDEAVARASQVMGERSGEVSDEAAEIVARAALKYADLSTERQRDTVFDLERTVSFEGDTGPYLLYANARIHSIFRKINAPLPSSPTEFVLAESPARELALTLLGFSEVVALSMDTLQPHRLCNYLFDLAQRFTAFYDACPVASASGSVRDERVALCALTSKTLELGLSLLGITALRQM